MSSDHNMTGPESAQRPHVVVARPSELTPTDLRAWRALQSEGSALSNPFLAPEFAIAVDHARPGVRVAVRRRSAGPDGFFAFESGRFGTALRVGHGVADHQAVVAPPADLWDIRDLLGPAGLHAARLENVPTGQLPESAERILRYPSPVIDLSAGYPAYVETRRKVSKNMMATVRRKERKLEREVGPIRFEFDSRDRSALRTLMDWKSEQYRRLGEWDRFAAPDIVALVEELADSTAPGCAGTLSLLWAGDQLAAAHFGLRSETTLCSWFPVYSPLLGPYSPGLLLHLLMAEGAAERGITLFDLGRGEHRYKGQLKTGELTLARGTVFRRSSAGLLLSAGTAPLDGARLWAARSPAARRVLTTARDGVLAAVARGGRGTAAGVASAGVPGQGAAPRHPSVIEPGPPAYVLGGHEAGLAVIRSLGRAGVRVVSVVSGDDEPAQRSRHVGEQFRSADPADHPDIYAQQLLALADRHGTGVVIPTTDESLEAVAAHHGELSRRHLVACPPPEVSRTFLDKMLTSEVAARAGVDAPWTATPATAAELDDLLGELRFPCLVKPRESYRYNRAFGVKMTRVHDPSEMRDAWQRAEAAGIGTLVQELIPGPETGGVNYNVYVVDGRPRIEFTSRKLRLSPRDFGYPSAVVSEKITEIVEPGRAIVAAMGIEGFANVEFKRDVRDGRYKLMEVNGRPNMSGGLAARCGVDFPLIAYRHLVTGTVLSEPRWDEGVHWINEIPDVRGVVARWRDGELSVRDGVMPYLSRHVFASFAARDPGPFIGRLAAKASLRSRAR